jgi:trehalose 6-phosphate synthase
MNDNEVLSRITELETLYKDKQVIIGVDRMDYTKGLPEKMEGFRVFLDEHPELRDKVILIQIAIPSREDVEEYQDLEGQVSKLVGQIIGQHGV